MSLAKKSHENICFVRNCVSAAKNQIPNIGVNRAYYAVFQRIKDFLESNGFLYRAFLDSIHQSKEREYSHGTLARALNHFASTKGKSPDPQTVVFIGNLYAKRKRADYYSDWLTPDELKESHEEAEHVLKYVSSL